MAAKMESAGSGDIDEDLYSRQLYVLGHEAMRRMQNANVLICGMSGLGLEVAKNVALGGVKSMTICDDRAASASDLATHYYVKTEQFGQTLAEVTKPHLSELNSYVPINIHTGELTEEVLKGFQVVVLTASSLDEQLRINKITHAHSIACIVADTRGLFGQLFCDFGKGFMCADASGRDPQSCLVSIITKDANGSVSTLDEQNHGLEDGDFVTFDEVIGMTELNGCEPRKITVISRSSFSIGDTTGLSEYVRGGVVRQVKMPKKIDFKPLAEALEEPEMIFTDYVKFDRPGLIHLGMQTVHAYSKKEGSLPKPGNAEDGAKFVALAKEINSASKNKLEEMDESVLTALASQCSGSLAPMCSVIGSMAAQEVMKACSGKFHPLKQWMYFDSLEALPDDKSELTAESLAGTGSRTDNQQAVLGATLQQKLANAKLFVVGSGAIGCELIKNFAMMGIATAPGAQVVVTDMDRIEKSNLNRQFLFRPWDVEKLKSDTAAAAAKVMNPEFQIVAHQARVGVETEDVYDEAFFNNLTCVVNALDNVQARQYMDWRCVMFRKPLLESGTEGALGNTLTVIPDMTESYNSSHDAPEKTTKSCTLKFYPFEITHTIQWSRDLFEGLFVNAPSSINNYLGQANFVKDLMKQPGSQALDTLSEIFQNVVDARPKTFADCVGWARLQFQDYYHDRIAQLLFNFPADYKQSNGMPFWSGTKRCPHPLIFDTEDETHYSFLVSAANLRAHIFGIEGSSDKAVVVAALEGIEIAPFKPRKGIKIDTGDGEDDGSAAAGPIPDDEATAKTLLAKLPKASELADLKVTPEDFEKDDDSNFHIDFVTAASNLRAMNYSIAPATRHETKRVAGKIIPAIATTTALVAGLVCLELIKIINGGKKQVDYKNGYVNLAMPLMIMSEPIAAPVEKYNGVEWTLWDRFEVQGDMTVQEFIDYFEKEHKLEVGIITIGKVMLWSFMLSGQKSKDRLAKKVSEAYVEITKQPLAAHVKYLEVQISCDDADGEDVEVPTVIYKLPQ